jgi:hypothetical protein
MSSSPSSLQPSTPALLTTLARMLGGPLDAQTWVCHVDGEPRRVLVKTDRWTAMLAIAPAAPTHSDRAALRSIAARSSSDAALIVLHPPKSGDWQHETQVYAAARLNSRVMPYELVDASLSIGYEGALQISNDNLGMLILGPRGAQFEPLQSEIDDDMSYWRAAGATFWQQAQRLAAEAA